jgi:hypothetical protein
LYKFSVRLFGPGFGNELLGGVGPGVRITVIEQKKKLKPGFLCGGGQRDRVFRDRVFEVVRDLGSQQILLQANPEGGGGRPTIKLQMLR